MVPSRRVKLTAGLWKRIFAFAGPAYLVSVGYMDPGNWATDIEGGARFGYMLIWVLLMSNIMAVVLQTLCARLGIVTGLDLAQGCRREYSRGLNLFLWALAEIAIASADTAQAFGKQGLTWEEAMTGKFNWYTWKYQQCQRTGTNWISENPNGIFRRTKADILTECKSTFGQDPPAASNPAW